ncbi:MAG: DUF2089 family protein [Clostridia bacterium]|nr:DUF2089 family protein [Clostridia bacterium]
MIKRISQCPACNSKLQIVTLRCQNCGLELHNEFKPDPFETLNSEQYEYLISFLKNRGNMKLLQAELNISYLNAKKKLDNLLMALGLLTKEKEGAKTMENIEIINTETWNTDNASAKASDIIKCKLKQCGGKATVSTLEGKIYEIIALKDGETFFCEALPVDPYAYRVFDIITDFLIDQGGKAPKGNARNYKVGEEKCDENTVAGIIGISYFKKSYGESTFDPVFIMAAILEWAGIVHNLRGFLELTEEYKKKICF